MQSYPPTVARTQQVLLDPLGLLALQDPFGQHCPPIGGPLQRGPRLFRIRGEPSVKVRISEHATDGVRKGASIAATEYCGVHFVLQHRNEHRMVAAHDRCSGADRLEHRQRETFGIFPVARNDDRHRPSGRDRTPRRSAPVHGTQASSEIASPQPRACISSISPDPANEHLSSSPSPFSCAAARISPQRPCPRVSHPQRQP